MPALEMPPAEEIEKAGVRALQSGTVSKEEVDQFLQLVGPQFAQALPKQPGPSGSTGPTGAKEKPAKKKKQRPITVTDVMESRKKPTQEEAVSSVDTSDTSWWDNPDPNVNPQALARSKKFKQKIGFEEMTKEDKEAGLKYDLLVDQPQVDVLKDMFKTLPGYDEREEGISKLQSRVDAAGMPRAQGTDLSPLVALLKAEHGKDMSGLSPKALGTDDTAARNKLILSYGKELQDAKEAKSKSFMDFIGKAKGGTYMDKLSEGLQRTVSQQFEGGGAGGGASFKQKKALTDLYQKSVKPLEEQLIKAQVARGTLREGGIVGESAFVNFLSRASDEKGPLSKSDLAQFSGNPAILKRLERAWELQFDMEHRFTKQDIKDLTTLIDLYIDFNRERVEKEQDRIINQVGPTMFGVPASVGKAGLVPKRGVGLAKRKIDTKPYDGTGDLPPNATLEQKRMKLKKMKEERDAGK
jgi:hypothetical protein